MNRFFDIEGDTSLQLAPWQLITIGKPLDIALFKLTIPLRFRSDIAGGVIVVPEGYISDLASIPRALWGLFSPDDARISLGAWVHDLLYQNKGVVFLEETRDESGTRIQQTNLTREACDRILAYEAMPELMADKFHQDTVYAALRMFGNRWL